MRSKIETEKVLSLSGSFTPSLISSSSFHRLDMTLAVAEALNLKPSRHLMPSSGREHTIV